MTPGDLVITVEFTTEPDEKTAFLSGLYANGGVISPNFARDNYDYTIAVPFGTEGFSISAQAENPYLEPELRQVSPESGVKDLDDELALNEGLNEYTITVTSQDTKTTQTYNIKAIKLPDLSLQTFTITRAENSFERELAPQTAQDVYVPYKDGLVIEAKPNDSGATISQSPAAIPALSEYINVSTAVTVTVSKSLPGVAAEYTAKGYAVNLHYVADMDLTPLAEGGYIGFIPAETSGTFYEVHTFFESGALSFLDKSTASIKADYLIVAGGGGSGGDRNGVTNSSGDFSGGGGAGGLIYKSKETLPIDGNSSVSIVIGTGGAGGVRGQPGGDGGYSLIGGVAAPGGGGGGGPYTDSSNNGRPGGSGGGAGAGSGASSGAVGAGKSNTTGNTTVINAGAIEGHNGGLSGQTSNVIDGGGGGGGAGGAGTPGTGTSAGQGGAGGAGWKPAVNDGWEWVEKITGIAEFSHGGADGGPKAQAGGTPGVNYGDGGSAGKNTNQAGARGHVGIVIVRFPHPGNQSEE